MISSKEHKRIFIAILAIAAGVKLLLMSAYRSTDFEVHRNWLAITHSLPLKQWYFEDRSLWTLDYPPFFAYFEYILSQFARFIDINMVKVENLEYASFATIAFQRTSVIVTDIVFIFFAWKLCERGYDQFNKKSSMEVHNFNIFNLFVFNGGLLFVDHIHFQYNGVLMGVFLCTLFFAKNDNLTGLVATFSILVFMKHLFAPLALIFAAFILKKCIIKVDSTNPKKFSYDITSGLIRLFGLCVVALVVVMAALGPFLLQPNGKEQIAQIASRLFPFGRGLVHAYWAPNVWALYCFGDKIIALLNRKLKGAFLKSALASNDGFNSTSGLVGEFKMEILPKITATHCLVLVVIFSLPAMWSVFKDHSFVRLVRALVYASLSSFMLGYHVHEKAIIIPWILQTLICNQSQIDGFLYLLLSASSMAGLFPLLPGKFEGMIKGFVFVTFMCLAMNIINSMQTMQKTLKLVLMSCIAFLMACLCYTEVIHWLVFSLPNGTFRLPFLPLMMTSVICAIFNIAVWILSAYLLQFGSP